MTEQIGGYSSRIPLGAVPEVIAVAAARRAVRTGHLREVRVRVGLSQADVARAIGVTQSAVSRWEAGARQRIERESAWRLWNLLRLLERVP